MAERVCGLLDQKLLHKPLHDFVNVFILQVSFHFQILFDFFFFVHISQVSCNFKPL